MREIRASVTRRGQISIPAAVRRHLGVNTPDKVAFVVDEDGTVTMRPVLATMTSLRGTLRPLRGSTSGDFEAEIAEAAEEEAARIVEKMRRQ